MQMSIQRSAFWSVYDDHLAKPTVLVGAEGSRVVGVHRATSTAGQVPGGVLG